MLIVSNLLRCKILRLKGSTYGNYYRLSSHPYTAFSETLQSVPLVHEYSKNAFSECKIKSVVLPNSLKEVWDNAFSECTSLTTLSIPANIREVRCYAFLECVNLETIRSYVVDPDNAYFENYCFMGVPKSSCTVYVPKGSLAAYRDHHIWGEFSHIVEMGDALKVDVNGDGEVNIADINTVIDVILSGDNNMNCDVNGDHEVNIADVNTIIDIILCGSVPTGTF